MSVKYDLPGMTGLAYDAAKNLYYFSSSNGDVFSFDPKTFLFTNKFHVDAKLSDIDVSPDGSYLIVGGQDAEIRSTGNIATEYKISTVDWSVSSTKIALDLPSAGGVYDVALIGDQIALTTFRNASGAVADVVMRKVNFATGAVTVISTNPDVGVTLSARASAIPSEGHRYVLVQESFTSSQNLYLYDVSASRFIASTNLYQWNVNVNYPSNPASISEAAGLISNVVDKNILIFDLKLNLVEKLTYAASVNTIVGSAFNAGGHQLFLWNASASTVDAYDVLSWKLVGSVNLATTLDPADSSQKGTMLVDSSGRSLILDTQKGFEVVSLASELKLTVTGGGNADLLYGAAGPDTLSGAAGDDTLYGGAGNDSLDGGDGASLMWGEEGDDQISGGSGFDNINGNQGADTAHGNDGDDWVVGGKDNDQVYGDAGNDIVYGNLGNDTVSGGDGNDWVRGGQGDDSVSGGAGNDVVWGDRGDDTVSGGAGADTFRFFSGGGVDRVTDFSYAEGDRVLIEGGATWTLAQSGSDTVVTLAGGADTLVLVGVNLSSLPAGWIAAG